MNSKLYKFIYLLLFTTVLFYSCSEPYTPDTADEDQQYVVEGFVEVGQGALPVYVILTRSIPFISEVDQTTFEGVFVDSALVIVNDGEKDVELIQLCTNDPDLPEEIREAAAEFLGVQPGEMGPNICIYVDVFSLVTKEVGRTYTLTIDIEEDSGQQVQLTAFTTVPRNIPLDKFRWDDPPGEPSDSLARLWATVNDLPETDYYRYLTAVADRGLIPPFQSVTDDTFFDGEEFEFPLNKAEYAEDEAEPNDFGLYPRGDSVFVKWMTMDKIHFDFWNTRDFAANSGGPFSNYTRIAGNVNGALGIWGGYSVNNYSLYCPPK